LLELADLALGFKKPKIKKKKASAGIHSHEKTEPYSSWGIPRCFPPNSALSREAGFIFCQVYYYEVFAMV